MTINDILNKLLDNANLGKAVADIGPGFALSFPLLMILSLVANFSIFPADRLAEIRDSKAKAIQAERQAKLGFCEILKAQNDPCSKDDADEGFVKGRRRIAQLGIEVEAYQEGMRTAAKSGKGPAPANPAGVQSLRDYELLVAQRELVEEAAAQVERYTNEETDASSLEFNIATFTRNMSAVIAFSVVFGVLLSQISHLVFVDLIFENTAAVKAIPKPSIPVTLSKEDEELVKNYYRYVEGAINLVFPVFLTAAVFPTYADKKLNASVSYFWTYTAGAALALG
jgi:hypothetical protein